MVEFYVGLDVSDKSTHLCVVDRPGGVIWSGACATDPEVIVRTLKARAAGLVRVILETGPLSTFLYHGLVERGVPVICVRAPHQGRAVGPGQQERPPRRRGPGADGADRLVKPSLASGSVSKHWAPTS